MDPSPDHREYGHDGRPRPGNAATDLTRIPCDYVIVAIGQSIVTKPFEQLAWQQITVPSRPNGQASVPGLNNIFAGGDAVSGPAHGHPSHCRGKVAAANIDAFLGFDHKISVDIEIPPAHFTNTPPCGRINLKYHGRPDCSGDFSLPVEGMTAEEARQEASRCLRCDHFGFGSFKGGRQTEW